MMNNHLTSRLIDSRIKTQPNSTLVIGYGNDLRGDDGVGQQVAHIIESWELPNLRSLAVQQLTPELVEELATVARVIFIDAYPANSEPAVKVYHLEPASDETPIGHTSDPRTLLALTQALHNYHPSAWLVTIPGVNFELGETLSPVAEQGLCEALEEIDYLIRQIPSDMIVEAGVQH